MWSVWFGIAHVLTPEEEVSAAIARCSAAVHPLPPLSAEQRARLGRAEVVKIVHHAADPNAPSRAVGIALLKGGRDALWVASQDPHTTVDPSLTEFIVEQLSLDHALWYGHLDLPYPLTDRQWVVESENTHALASRGCWEHRWSLVENGLERVRVAVATGERPITLERVDAALFTPVNHGNWLMAPLADGRTLVAYQATSVVGGSIPDWLVLKLTMSRLETLLRDLEVRASTWAPGHYRAGHAPMYGGDGRPVPPLE